MSIHYAKTHLRNIFIYLLRLTTVLVSRFFLDLREASDTDSDNSSSAAIGASSTIEFAAGRIVGNLGESLDNSTSTWLSGTQDDVAEDADDTTRFSSLVYSIYTHADRSFSEDDHADVGSAGEAEGFAMADLSVGSASRDLDIAVA